MSSFKFKVGDIIQPHYGNPFYDSQTWKIAYAGLIKGYRTKYYGYTIEGLKDKRKHDFSIQDVEGNLKASIVYTRNIPWL